MFGQPESARSRECVRWRTAGAALISRVALGLSVECVLDLGDLSVERAATVQCLGNVLVLNHELGDVNPV
jgi:hypothetical protein